MLAYFVFSMVRCLYFKFDYASLPLHFVSPGLAIELCLLQRLSKLSFFLN